MILVTIVGMFLPAALAGANIGFGWFFPEQEGMRMVLIFPALAAAVPCAVLAVAARDGWRRWLGWTYALAPLALGVLWLGTIGHGISEFPADQARSAAFGATLIAASIWGLAFGIALRRRFAQAEVVERFDDDLRSGKASG